MDKEEQYEKTLEAAIEFLRKSGLLDEGLKIIKKSMAPGIPFQVLELMNDEERISQLVEDVAEVYVDAGFSIEELEFITQFYLHETGQKLVKLNAKLAPKTGEITSDWVYDIIEEVQKEERANDAKTDKDEPTN